MKENIQRIQCRAIEKEEEGDNLDGLTPKRVIKYFASFLFDKQIIFSPVLKLSKLLHELSTETFLRFSKREYLSLCNTVELRKQIGTTQHNTTHTTTQHTTPHHTTPHHNTTQHNTTLNYIDFHMESMQ